MASSGTNNTPLRPLSPGIISPLPTFFFPNEDLDLQSLEAHVAYLARAGVHPLLAGTMGEGIHLAHGERTKIIHATRKALDGAGFPDFPIIVGAGGGSTRETVALCEEVANAGADAVIVITPGYFSGVLANHRQALKEYYTEVARKSPVPVLIYNYPGASGGIDLDSDFIVELAIAHTNLCGVKLTCGNVGKLTRIAATVTDPAFKELHPRKDPQAPFLVLGGYADIIVSSAFVRGHGAITGLANIAPRALVRLFEVSEAATKDPSRLQEAQHLQGVIARADFTIARASISGTKFLMGKLHGYGGLPRRPLPLIEPEDAKRLWEHPHVQEIINLERELSGNTLH